MKMKKMMTAALSLILILSMGITAFATDVTGPTPDNNISDIKATYSNETPEPETVYYVDVEWGSMEYTYDTQNTQQWNPNTLMFEVNQGKPKWTWTEEGANKIKVTNHSNIEIAAQFTYEQKNNSNIEGSFDKDSIILEAPKENSDLNTAPNDTVTLTLDGALSDSQAQVVGAVTVTIKGRKIVTVATNYYEPGSQINLYMTDEPGIYTAIYTTPMYMDRLRFEFVINGKTYHTTGDVNQNNPNRISVSQWGSDYIVAGATYEYVFDMNTYRYTRKKIS